jgi:hypothetical protein
VLAAGMQQRAELAGVPGKRRHALARAVSRSLCLRSASASSVLLMSERPSMPARLASS